MNRILKLSACIYLVTTFYNLMAQSKNPVLVVITSSQSTIPDIEDKDELDNEIKKLKDSLPSKLETQIKNLAKGKIIFLEREMPVEFREALDYENPADLMAVIPDSLKKKINAVLLTKIEKPNAKQINIKGKIVDLNRVILSVREMPAFLDSQNVFEANVQSSVRSLAKAIANDLLPTPSNWLVDPKIPLPILNRKISYLSASFAIATIGTYFWYQNEDDMARKHHAKYDVATTTQEAVTQRSSAEKAKSRSEVAENVFYTTGAVALVLLINDIFFQNESNENDARQNKGITKKLGQNFKLEINQVAETEVISFGITMNF